jgi:hypothetical protein
MPEIDPAQRFRDLSLDPILAGLTQAVLGYLGSDLLLHAHVHQK